MPSYTPISYENHKNKGWIRHTSLSFAKTDTIAPVYLSELSIALQEMPIAFIRNKNSFVPVVVMGLAPNQNLFISDDGKWLSNYMPVTYRSSPFELLSISESENEQALCIDQSCVVEEGGEPFFNEEGKASDEIAKIFSIIQGFNSTRGLTYKASQEIARLGLFESWDIIIDRGDKKESVSGLFKINESAFNELNSEEFNSLRVHQALPLIYAQLFSNQKIQVLSYYMNQRIAAVQEKIKEDGEVFSFAGI